MSLLSALFGAIRDDERDKSTSLGAFLKYSTIITPLIVSSVTASIDTFNVRDLIRARSDQITHLYENYQYLEDSYCDPLVVAKVRTSLILLEEEKDIPIAPTAGHASGSKTE